MDLGKTQYTCVDRPFFAQTLTNIQGVTKNLQTIEIELFHLSLIYVYRTSTFLKPSISMQTTLSSKLDESIAAMQNTSESLNDWSANSNLLLNPKKTKSIMFSTVQMSRYHSLDKIEVNLSCTNIGIKRATSTKILGVIFTKNFNWNEHIKYLISSCHGILATLCKLKHIAPYTLRKQLVEMLVISKLDYCDTVYSPLHDYQIKRLQRIQNACAGFVKVWRKTSSLECGNASRSTIRKWNF